MACSSRATRTSWSPGSAGEVDQIARYLGIQFRRDECGDVASQYTVAPDSSAHPRSRGRRPTRAPRWLSLRPSSNPCRPHPRSGQSQVAHASTHATQWRCQTTGEGAGSWPMVRASRCQAGNGSSCRLAMVDGSADGRTPTHRPCPAADEAIGTAPNVILTGIPRSGTTLVCHLINTLPDGIACTAYARARAGRRRSSGGHGRRALLHFPDPRVAPGRRHCAVKARRQTNPGPASAITLQKTASPDDNSYGAVSFTRPDSGLSAGSQRHLGVHRARSLRGHDRHLRDRHWPRSPILGSWNSDHDAGVLTATLRSADSSIDTASGPACPHPRPASTKRCLTLCAWFFRRFRTTLPPSRCFSPEVAVPPSEAYPGAVSSPRPLQHGALSRAIEARYCSPHVHTIKTRCYFIAFLKVLFYPIDPETTSVRHYWAILASSPRFAGPLQCHEFHVLLTCCSLIISMHSYFTFVI